MASFRLAGRGPSCSNRKSQPVATQSPVKHLHHVPCTTTGNAASKGRCAATQQTTITEVDRPLLAATALAASVILSLAAPADSYAAFATQTVDQSTSYMGQEYDEEFDEEDDVMEYDSEASPELLSFMAKYDTLSADQLVAAREELGFRRSMDGRVFLRANGGDMFAVKPDMKAPGVLLLRDQEGYCFYIPPDGEGELYQIDLSDDLVVAQLFSNGVWQELLEPLDAQAEDGSVQQLQMSAEEFRSVVSLLDGALEGQEEELPE